MHRARTFALSQPSNQAGQAASSNGMHMAHAERQVEQRARQEHISGRSRPADAIRQRRCGRCQTSHRQHVTARIWRVRRGHGWASTRSNLRPRFLRPVRQLLPSLHMQSSSTHCSNGLYVMTLHEARACAHQRTRITSEWTALLQRQRPLPAVLNPTTKQSTMLLNTRTMLAGSISARHLPTSPSMTAPWLRYGGESGLCGRSSCKSLRRLASLAPRLGRRPLPLRSALSPSSRSRGTPATIVFSTSPSTSLPSAYSPCHASFDNHVHPRVPAQLISLAFVSTRHSKGAPCTKRRE
jgi:hypothetical protein